LAALSDGLVIWVIALLREVIWNIRIGLPYTQPGVVNISYDFTEENNLLTLTLLQQQVQKTEREVMREEPAGVKMANELLGFQGAGFGSIELIGTYSNKRADSKGVDVVYTTNVTFALSD
jgi:hypothetical protein